MQRWVRRDKTEFVLPGMAKKAGHHQLPRAPGSTPELVLVRCAGERRSGEAQRVKVSLGSVGFKVLQNAVNTGLSLCRALSYFTLSLILSKPFLPFVRRALDSAPRGLELSSLFPPGGSQPSATPLLRDVMLSSDLHRHQACVWCTHKSRQNTHIK